MTAPSPHTHPAERETPAGEAMREAVAQWLEAELGLYVSEAAEKAGEFCGPSGPIASELARLTAERDEAREAFMRVAEAVGAPASERLDLEVRDRFARLTERAEKAETFALACELQITTAEAALTTLRADHAAEVARKDAALKPFAEHDPYKADPRLQDRICDWFSPSDFEAASMAYLSLAPKETTDA